MANHRYHETDRGTVVEVIDFDGRVRYFAHGAPYSSFEEARTALQTVGEAYAEAVSRGRAYTVHQHGSTVLVDFPPVPPSRVGHLATLRFPYPAMADAFVSSLR